MAHNGAVTDKQLVVLRALAELEVPVSARRLTDKLERPRRRTERFSFGEVRGHLYRLERKKLVKRTKVKGEKTGVAFAIAAKGRKVVEKAAAA